MMQAESVFLLKGVPSMSDNQSSRITISAFSWIPDFAIGNSRDISVRWALAELGLDYDTHLIHASEPRSEAYRGWQPFGQVPAMRDGETELFESGAILLHLAGREGKLLPTGPQARATAISWLFGALATIEGPLRVATLTPLFHGEEEWSHGAVEKYSALSETRLQGLSDSLAGKDWIAGEFSIADIMLVYVLKTFGGEPVMKFPDLVTYVERGMEREGYKRAIEAMEADLTADPIAA